MGVEVAAASDPPLDRIEPVLPGNHPRLGRPPVLDEDQLTVGPQYTADFAERLGDIGDGAQGPGAEHGIDASIVERNGFGGKADKIDGEGSRLGARQGHLLECR